MPEHFAFLQEIDDAAFVQKLHRSSADDIQESSGLTRLAQDRGAAGKYSFCTERATRSSSSGARCSKGGYRVRKLLTLHHPWEYRTVGQTVDSDRQRSCSAMAAAQSLI
jgi:hypothetical protein